MSLDAQPVGLRPSQALRLPLELGRATAAAVGALQSPAQVVQPVAVRAYGLANAGRAVARPTSALTRIRE